MDIRVKAESTEYQEEAWKLAERLGLDVFDLQAEDSLHELGLMLEVSGEGIALTDGKLYMRGDLTSMLPRLRRNNLLQEMLVKASRLKTVDGVPLILDATAGMGEDSLLLAAAGFEVILYEYDPIIGVLLEDSLKRAAKVPELSAIIGRMHFVQGDSVNAMRQMAKAEGKKPDVVFLDPMFPERQKSGLIKKKFQLLQQLEAPCMEEEELLKAAIELNPRKIVIKRPLKGPYLAGVKPSYTLEGKAIRYDCILGK